MKFVMAGSTSQNLNVINQVAEELGGRKSPLHTSM